MPCNNVSSYLFTIGSKAEIICTEGKNNYYIIIIICIVPTYYSAAIRTSHSFVSVGGSVHGRSAMVAVDGRQQGVLIREVVGDRVDGHVDDRLDVDERRL